MAEANLQTSSNNTCAVFAPQRDEDVSTLFMVMPTLFMAIWLTNTAESGKTDA